MDFDRIIAPMQRDAFISRYWEQTWLHLKGAPGRFTDLMPWSDLNLLLANARLAPPLVRLSRNGEPLDSAAFMHTPPGAGHLPRLDAGKVAVLLAQGATLVLHMVEDISPTVRALARAVGAALQARSYVNLYASWKTQNGFDLHWDAHEVLVLQVHGRKRWRIHAPTQDQPLDAGVPPEPVGAPVWEGMLEEGDILYLPRGWWHMAEPVNEPSLHLTIGVSPVHGLNMLNWLAGRLRQHSALARQNLPLLNGPQARSEHLAALKALVDASLTEAALEEFLHDAAEHQHGRPDLQLPQGPCRQLAPLNENSLIRLASSASLLLRTRGDAVTFNAYGKTYRVPAFVGPALALLGDARAVAVAELRACLENDLARASLMDGLAMLARAGVVLVENS
jgi:ribosomal protein L16 Arg81 hydroxylase